MKYYKHFYWVYLILGVLFFYKGYSNLNIESESPYVSFFLGALAIFMFFFRRNFVKKMENHKNNK